MGFEKYTLEDFIMDESFYKWVKIPTSEDCKFWESYLKNHPGQQKDVDEAKKIIQMISFQDKSFNKEEVSKLWDEIKSETKHEKSMDSNRFNPWKLLKVAAVLVPFVIAGVLFVFYRQVSEPTPQIVQQIIEKKIPKGQKLTVFLSDGSKVILNSESSIKYTKPFGENQRVVELEGEAFFNVTPDQARPFIVRSGSMETEVVGTSFNVKAYPSDSIINVAVKTGKVMVEDKGQKVPITHEKAVMLLPLEMASYSSTTHEISVSDFDPKVELSWSEGTLYFDGASMAEFVAKLERWYGVDIQVNRKTPIKKGIVGEFKNQSLEEILMGTHEASEFEYEIHGDKVIIK